MVSIKKIKPNPDNPNEHPEVQLKGLEVTLKENCIRHPLIVSNQSGLLVAGHARFEVMRRLGMKKVPVVYQDFDSSEKEYQFMVADNESQRKSWFNPIKFSETVKKLKIDKVNHKAMGIYDSMLYLDSERSDKEKGSSGSAPDDTIETGYQEDQEESQGNQEGITVKIHFDSKKEHEDFIQKCIKAQELYQTNDIKETLVKCLNIIGT